jgi:hypothetical protein
MKNETMEAKIKEVQDYFKAKILASDFKVIAISEYVCDILIDENYKFGIWIGNIDIKDSVKIYNLYQSNFIYFQFEYSECIKLHKIFAPIKKEYVSNKLKAEKLAQIEKLQSEVKNL